MVDLRVGSRKHSRAAQIFGIVSSRRRNGIPPDRIEDLVGDMNDSEWEIATPLSVTAYEPCKPAASSDRAQNAWQGGKAVEFRAMECCSCNAHVVKERFSLPVGDWRAKENSAQIG